MAKKKTGRPKPDQHKSGFMVRLPEAYREKLKALKAITGRPYTTEVRWLLDARLREAGIAPP